MFRQSRRTAEAFRFDVFTMITDIRFWLATETVASYKTGGSSYVWKTRYGQCRLGSRMFLHWHNWYRPSRITISGSQVMFVGIRSCFCLSILTIHTAVARLYREICDVRRHSILLLFENFDGSQCGGVSV